VISPVFPRGPLSLRSLGFLHDGHNPRRLRRRRIAPTLGRVAWVGRALAGLDQNLSRAACSSA
jgi:hypothetical protein